MRNLSVSFPPVSGVSMEGIGLEDLAEYAAVPVRLPLHLWAGESREFVFACGF